MGGKRKCVGKARGGGVDWRMRQPRQVTHHSKRSLGRAADDPVRHAALLVDRQSAPAFGPKVVNDEPDQKVRGAARRQIRERGGGGTLRPTRTGSILDDELGRTF